MLAHDRLHRVPGITLPPGDANMNPVFIVMTGESSVAKKTESRYAINKSAWGMWVASHDNLGMVQDWHEGPSKHTNQGEIQT